MTSKSLHFLLLIGLLCGLHQPIFAQQKHLSDQQMLVVSAHPLASAAGLQVLQQGGNAFDAGITVEFCLAVVLPVAGNIGGGGFAMLRTEQGEISSLDYREQAPANIRAALYVAENEQARGTASTLGPLAVGIPGTVAGMYQLHQRHGKLAWADLLQPAIDLARGGWALTEKEAQLLSGYRSVLNEMNAGDCYLCGTTEVQPGDTLRNEALAQVLERIRDQGADGFYRGETAEQMSAFMGANGGLIDLEDLANYQAIWREPMHGQFKGMDVYSMAPPSSGGVLLLQMLEMLVPYPLSDWGPGDHRTIHLLAEVERRAYADRSLYLGDPAFVDVPVARLLDSSYLACRMRDFSPKAASRSADIAPGLGPLPESEETTHYIVVDARRNVMSATTSLNGAYGSKVIVPGLGFLLNNTIDDFSLAPGIPNSYGLLGSEANAVAPGKRMLSSMTPTLVCRDGAFLAALGTPGGSTIPTTVLQVFLNHFVFGMNSYDAVARGRYHHQWMPDQLRLEEAALSRRVRRSLRKKGHVLKESAPYGRAACVLQDVAGRLEGGADPRGDDAVAGTQ